METETYKVAKELLDEFASDQETRALNVSILYNILNVKFFQNLPWIDPLKEGGGNCLKFVNIKQKNILKASCTIIQNIIF